MAKLIDLNTGDYVGDPEQGRCEIITREPDGRVVGYICSSNRGKEFPYDEAVTLWRQQDTLGLILTEAEVATRGWPWN